jgi:hypothetical protein
LVLIQSDSPVVAWRWNAPPWFRSRGPALAAVVLAHLLLLLWAWNVKPPPADERDNRRSSTLRLLPSPSAQPDAARSLASATVPPLAPPAMAAPSTALPPGLRTQVNLLFEPAEWTSASVPNSSTTAESSQSFGTVGLDGAAHVPAAAASGAQRVATRPSREVLRGSLANPATLDPRSNSPRPSMEEKLALDLNPDLCLKEERQPDGTIRRYLAKRKEVPTAAQAYTNVRTERIRVCS